MKSKNNETNFYYYPPNLFETPFNFKFSKRGYGKKVFKREMIKAKFKNFVKRHRKALVSVLMYSLAFILFLILNAIGNRERGYSAVGGEMLVPALPLIIITLRDLIQTLIEKFK